MAEIESGQLREFLLPYDERTVKARLVETGWIGPRDHMLPWIRCTEDRPRGSVFSVPTPPEANSMAGNLTRVVIPERPEPADFLTPEGMMANMMRTGSVSNRSLVRLSVGADPRSCAAVGIAPGASTVP